MSLETITKLTAADLAALLCARICHDILNPVGALHTGLEVLDDEDNVGMHEDAMDLIKLSARQANVKLVFLRLAFGAGGSAPGIISTSELKRLIFDVYGDGKAELDWQISQDGLEKQAGRLLLNMTMLAVMTVPRGGDIVFKASEQDGDIVLSITCTGPKARLEEAVVKTLAGGAPDDGFDGRNVQPFYTGMIARDAGGRVAASIEDETVSFVCKIPVSS